MSTIPNSDIKNQDGRLFSEEAEQSTLGAMFLSADAVNKAVADKVTADTFYSEPHRIIFKAMLALHERKESVDFVTVSDELKKSGNLEKVGGGAYIAELADSVPSAASIGSHIKILFERWDYRKTLQYVEDCRNALENGEDPQESKRILTTQLSALELKRTAKKPQSLAEIIEEISDAKIEPSKPITTGYSDLDKILNGGFDKKELIIIGARPAVGKTTLALNFAIRAAKQGHTTLFLSLEMPKAQVLNKIASNVNQTDYNVIKNAKAGTIGDHYVKVNAEGIADKIIVHDVSLTIGELKAHVAQTVTELAESGQTLDMVIVDYLQLVSLGRKSETRYSEVSEITRQLKALAMELDIPVIAPAQLSRDGKADPELHHLKESGELEQSADKVIFLYRGLGTEEKPIEPLNVKIAKNRTGYTETIRLTFRKAVNRFELSTKAPEPKAKKTTPWMG